MSGLEELRARHALEEAGVEMPQRSLEAASSVSNEVWLSDHHVIRMSSDPGRRLRREATLVADLPPEVRYPKPVAHGRSGGTDWFVLARASGSPLSRTWPDLSREQRRAAVGELAGMLRALHATPTPIWVAALTDPPQGLRSEYRSVDPLLEAFDRAVRLTNVDQLILREAAEYIERHHRAVEPFDVSTLIHGDLTFENVLWSPNGVTALLDFEYSRGAPADLDLDVLLRFCAYPELHVAADYEHRTHSADYADVPRWLAEDYPDLFGRANQLERLRIFSLAFDVRELLAHPPTVRVGQLPDLHPLNRIIRVLERRSYLDTLSRAKL